MKVLSKNILTVVTAIALFMLPLLFSGCDAAKSNAKYLYDAINNYYENRVDVEKWQDTTYTFKKVTHAEEKVELDYKKAASDTETTKGTFTDKTDITETFTVALKKVGEDDFVGYFESNNKTTVFENGLKNDQTLKQTTTVNKNNEKYYFSARTSNGSTNYYIICESVEQENEETPVTNKYYNTFDSKTDFMAAMDIFINGYYDDGMVDGMNNIVNESFFEWQPMSMYLPGIEYKMSGKNLDVKFDMDMVYPGMGSATMMCMNMNISYKDNLPAEVKETMKRITKEFTSEETVTMTIENSAKITVPQLSTDYTDEGEIDLDMFKYGYSQWIEELPEINFGMMN